MKRSNCFLGAIVIRRRLGGKFIYRPGWRQGGVSSGGWHGFLDNPWGHFWVELSDGTLVSYSARDKGLPAYRQLWFRGYIKRRRPHNEV